MSISDTGPRVTGGISSGEIALACLFPFLVAAGFAAAKIALGEMPPVLLSALRHTIAAAVLVWLFPPPRGVLWRLFLVAFVASSVQFSLTYAGFARLDVSTAALLVQSEVPFAILLAVLIGREKASPRRWLGTGIAMLGTTIVLGTPELRGEIMGAFLILARALAWAVGQVMVANLGNIDPFRITTWITVFATIQLWPLAFFIEGNPLPFLWSIGPAAAAAIVFIGIGPTVIGYRIWYGLIGRHGVGPFSPFLLLIPVFSMLIGVIGMGDTLQPITLTGGAVTLAGIAITLTRAKASQVKSP